MALFEPPFEILSDPSKGLVKAAIACAVIGVMFGLLAGADPFSVGLLGAGLVMAGAVLCADRGKGVPRETPSRARPPAAPGHGLAAGHTAECQGESNHFQEMVGRLRDDQKLAETSRNRTGGQEL
jgi:hypothetical protein